MQKNLFSRLSALLALCSFSLLATQCRLESAGAACCYFAAKDKDISQPGQKAFISWNPKDKVESFTVQAKFEGNAVDFGMVIPSPARPKLDEMPRDFFKDLAIYTILMPLPEPIDSHLEPFLEEQCFAMDSAAPAPVSSSSRKSSVKVLESGVVGSLDYKIIVASDAAGLYDWLKMNKYSYAGDESTLKFYIDKKWFFTVMKIDPKQMKKSAGATYLGEVTPTRFTFSSQECVYPLKITQISVKDKTDALLYVQSPDQMDLPGDWSFMHSYRPMYLTYMLGCSADPAQQKELNERNKWLETKRQKDPKFETSKLEWARKLSDADLNVLNDPIKNYGQMGAGDLPAGARVILLADFLKEVKTEYLKNHKGKLSDYAKDELARMEDRFQPTKGLIVKNDPKAVGRGFISTQYTWYPAREAPQDEVKGLSRLKGHLQKGMWLTKIRKQMRKDEMTRDLVFAALPQAESESYVRIMPTSPP